ncbi:MAG: alginate export family protein [Pseudomonadales bacterium]|jgi:hypothetical protein|nr:alginate export family protein [Pseudomonadales bacterium]MDP7595661.1 alginate export family protein [Pseudomonadales bacterium]HJN51053.1 alginate export family protein [Pseudomonadales bacterium]|tara:strand:- start:225 stop:1619 length:1395 start_codon:yes stop_codon:yes gene_type:complete
MQLKTLTFHGPLMLAALLTPSVATAEDHQPWRLQQALHLPQSLILSGTHRTRYETLSSQFRATRNGSDQVLVTRTTLLAALQRGRFTVGAELMDSRAALDDVGTPISTGIVNSGELLQAYVHLRGEDHFSPGSRTDLRIGRITMDVGSRRFVARNRYRNTINAFTGIDWQLQRAGGSQLRAFFLLPVNRKPNTPAKLRNNDFEFDEQDSEVIFWGLHYAATLPSDDHGELLYFGLNEDDSTGRPTRNRKLTTIGVRLHRKPQLSRFDYQLESALQFGESRTSTAATNTTDLDHFAHFQHAELGYSFDHPWRPRLILQYDYATGDDNPTDADNERFDTLFGARRFDFGPTGIYGPFARANLNTPGLRLHLKPSAAITTFITYRAYWLASDRDAWTTSHVQDPTGATDRFIAQQIEARLRWNVHPNNIRLEAGIARLFAGKFMDNAPNTNGQGDATYFYSQVTLSF